MTTFFKGLCDPSTHKNSEGLPEIPTALALP